MKRFAALCILLTFGCGSAFASVNVTNLLLEKNSTFSEFSIECDQAFEYTHRIVEATPDKPHRIVVDIMDAVHQLPQNNFAQLPPGSIERIRTSQYSVTPRKVVRVVLDVKGKLTYKVSKQDRKITLLISTPQDQNFPVWSAVAGQPEVHAAKGSKAREMPARPGNEAAATVATRAAPDDAGLQLAPTQAVTEPSSPKEKEAAAESRKAHPKITEADIAAFAEVFVGSPSPAAGQSKLTPDKTPGNTDSATITPRMNAPGGKSAGGDTADLPPKSEKTGLPDARVKGEKPESATTDKAAKPGAEPEKQRSTQGALGPTASADQHRTAESSPDAIHEKYQAKSRRGYHGYADRDQLSLDDYRHERPLDDVERIRQKYRRGISFVQNSDEARRLARQRQEDQEQGQTAPLYDEFLPYREIVVYSTGGRRDPFAPLIADAERAAEKMELPDVRSLRLIGVLQDNRKNSALFEDFNGYAYILQTGDPVRNGFLATIGEDYVVFQVRQYGWTRTIALELEEDN